MKKFLLAIIAIIICNIGYSQVSYMSKPIPDQPYVAPVDLSLLKEVNQQRQEKYDQNHAILREKFLAIKDLFNYVDKENFNTLVNEYNSIRNTANNNDISNPKVFNYIVDKLDYLKGVINYVIKNPDKVLTPTFFQE